MTMIELVAALALLVVILGVLLALLNAATSLWSASRSQQRERAAGQNVLSLIAEDLQQAVTDSGFTTNAVSQTWPTFALDARTNRSETAVQVVLRFARPAPRQLVREDTAGVPLSLAAVLYTYYKNTLFRHVVPLSQPSFEQPLPLGELLDQARELVDNTAFHDQIMEAETDPAVRPDIPWSYTLLARRVGDVAALAALPAAYVRESGSGQVTPPREQPFGLSTPPQYDYLESNALPDHLDLALRLYSEADWNTLLGLQDDASEAAARRRALLGAELSARIVFAARGGSRLP